MGTRERENCSQSENQDRGDLSEASTNHKLGDPRTNSITSACTDHSVSADIDERAVEAGHGIEFLDVCEPHRTARSTPTASLPEDHSHDDVDDDVDGDDDDDDDNLDDEFDENLDDFYEEIDVAHEELHDTSFEGSCDVLR
ncbi:coiled-coil domain-containing protein 1-like, partial [Hyalella azteca]|uniref:Coiled-coil domain-containing protein 1-like n=1 Tax=Hyalella azteca TaxID=294128 RepID=A0A979FV25_HYAAZ